MFSLLKRKPYLFRPYCAHTAAKSWSDPVNSPQVASPFAKARAGPFVQSVPYLENSFNGDAFLKRNLERILPRDVNEVVQLELSAFGTRIATDIYKLGRQCELTPPHLQVQDAWANPHNTVVTCDSWKELKKVSAHEGLIALAYERNPSLKEFSRLIQMTKNFLFYPSSGLYSCPLAMTDGAAKTLEVHGLKELDNAFSNLTSRDPQKFWTSGQWMTEKRGGSDVAASTETIAIPDPNSKDIYHLYGYKFFSSATDADIALALARTVDPSTGKTTPGTKGLSLFLLKVDQPNHLQVMRLKQKLGTKQLPTGELLLDGLEARLISPIGRGVASISPMLAVTRLHNAAASVSSMRRIISLARDYAQRRTAFGRKVSEHPLHVRTLAAMELECRAGFSLFMEASRLLSIEESRGTAGKDQLLRLLLPLLKLYTGKQCIQVISEGLECFGGQGYMEDTGIPSILRDAQVTPIWEGTTNILSLDVLRAVGKSQGLCLEAYYKRIQSVLDLSSNHAALAASFQRLEDARSAVLQFGTDNMSNPERVQYYARDWAFGLARSLAGALLLEHACWAGASDSDRASAERWLSARDLLPSSISSGRKSVDGDAHQCDLDRALVYDGYDAKNLLSPLF